MRTAGKITSFEDISLDTMMVGWSPKCRSLALNCRSDISPMRARSSSSPKCQIGFTHHLELPRNNVFMNLGRDSAQHHHRTVPIVGGRIPMAFICTRATSSDMLCCPQPFVPPSHRALCSWLLTLTGSLPMANRHILAWCVCSLNLCCRAMIAGRRHSTGITRSVRLGYKATVHCFQTSERIQSQERLCSIYKALVD